MKRMKKREKEKLTFITGSVLKSLYIYINSCNA